MPSIVQFTDLNIKQKQLEDKERMDNRFEAKDSIKDQQLEDRKRTRTQVRPEGGRSEVQGERESKRTIDEEEEQETRMRIATIAALAEEIRRRRIVRGPGVPGEVGGNSAVKEDLGKSTDFFVQ
jgi:hypothetical protein